MSAPPERGRSGQRSQPSAGVEATIGRPEGKRGRPSGRRIWRNCLLGAVGGLIILAIFGLLGSRGNVFRASMASAYAAFAMLAATLILGPINVLRRRRNPVSTYLRRDIGIWAAALALVHVVLGLQVHMGGRFWLYFVYPANEARLLPMRHDLFGLANDTGLAAMLVLALLLTLSNNAALRALGPLRWKGLQRWNYGAFALTIVHGAAYQVLERRELLFVAVASAVVLTVVSLQVAGVRRRLL
jgi:methionine sulfoxide reductase heme-binding subunit